MRELHPWNSATALDDRHNPAQQCPVPLVPEAQAVMGDATGRRHMRRLGEHDAGTAHGTRTKVLDMPIVSETFGGAVLAHR